MTSRRRRSSKSSPQANRTTIARLLVVAGPSGVGKTSLVATLLRKRPDLVLSLSATTRAPRAGEVDGRDYRFLTLEEFARLEADGAFLESAEVFGRRYGTPRAPVDDAIARGQTVVLEIDVQGARQVKERMPEALTVFVDPPSREVLRSRLAGRGTEDEAALERRLAEADKEMAASGWFDARVVNEDLEDAADQLLRILDEHEMPPPGQGAANP